MPFLCRILTQLRDLCRTPHSLSVASNRQSALQLGRSDLSDPISAIIPRLSVNPCTKGTLHLRDSPTLSFVSRLIPFSTSTSTPLHLFFSVPPETSHFLRFFRLFGSGNRAGCVCLSWPGLSSACCAEPYYASFPWFPRALFSLLAAALVWTSE